MKPGLSSLLAIGITLMATPGQAAPFVPKSEIEIVQRLPYRVDAAERERRSLLARDPQRQPLALAAARSAIERARTHGDPRELGLAQAALAPWWSQADAPVELRLLRASILQSQHHFEAAQTELRALTLSPTASPTELAQARLSLAAVLQLRGQFHEARQHCEQAAAFEPAALTAAVCVAELKSLRGQEQVAWQDLTALARRAPRDPWIMLVRAELAERLGDERAAPLLYLQAIHGRDDVYSRAAYADWLLDRDRTREALQLIDASADAESDALLLRRAIALKRLGERGAAAVAAQVRQRLAGSALREPGLHAREQARFALDVEGDARTALTHATKNWRLQREPADAVLLLRAALAAGSGAQARQARAELADFVRRTGWRDARLAGFEARSNS